jgi:hypothetical protein
MNGIFLFSQITQSRSISEWKQDGPIFHHWGDHVTLHGTLQLSSGTVIRGVEANLTPEEESAIRDAMRPIEERIAKELGPLSVGELTNNAKP